jgi:hypothetical protein
MLANRLIVIEVMVAILVLGLLIAGQKYALVVCSLLIAYGIAGYKKKLHALPASISLILIGSLGFVAFFLNILETKVGLKNAVPLGLIAYAAVGFFSVLYFNHSPKNGKTVPRMNLFLILEAGLAIIFLLQSFSVIDIIPLGFASWVIGEANSDMFSKVVDSLELTITVIIAYVIIFSVVSWLKSLFTGNKLVFEFSHFSSWMRPPIAAVSAALMTILASYALIILNPGYNSQVTPINFYFFSFLAFDILLALEFDSLNNEYSKAKKKKPA